MPEFIITTTYRTGYSEHRAGNDKRHTRAILGGLRGRYPGATFSVHRIGIAEDVTTEFAGKAQQR
jgi:hypothetical protein